MSKLWQWLNGFKTYIGAIGFGIAHALYLAGKIDAQTEEWLQTLFVTVFGIGVGHKLEKAKQPNPAPET